MGLKINIALVLYALYLSQVCIILLQILCCFSKRFRMNIYNTSGCKYNHIMYIKSCVYTFNDAALK